MKQAAGIVTDHGGRTSHAAIVSRELGIPAIVGTGEATDILADAFAQRFERLSSLFDERNKAVKRAVASLIEEAHERDTPVGICGQAPSDYPDFAAFLVENGIDSISLNPDSVLEVVERAAEQERNVKKTRRAVPA